MVAIPGTADPGHLRANTAAAELAQHLTDAEVTHLTSLIDESQATLETAVRRSP